MSEMDIEQFAKMLGNSVDDVEKDIMEGMNEVSEDLLGLSGNLAPLDEGGLRENGSVVPAKKQGNEIRSQVGYSKEYSLKMHEDIYTPSVPGTGRKFLEKPTKANEKKYADYLAEKVMRSFK